MSMLRSPKHSAARRARWSRRTKVVAVVAGATLAGTAAFATSNWIVGLNSGSSGEAQSADISNLTIAAVASPSATNLLYPGASGDVVVTISNPNPYPVTITAFQLPTDTTYAQGFTTSALSTTQTGCLSTTPSDVVWSDSTSTSGTSVTLTTPLVVAGSGQTGEPLTVTLTDAASMTASAPAECASTYFEMPALTGVTASAGGTPTDTPATDSWTS